MKELAERGEKWARRNGRSPYDVMNDRDICDLPVQELAAQDSVLFIWATDPKLDLAFKVIEAWGFKYVSVGYYWVKTNPLGLKARLGLLTEAISPYLGKTGFEQWVRISPEIIEGFHFGLGYGTRANIEVCLQAKRGRGLKRVDNSIERMIMAPVGEHSKKPHEARLRIERLYGDVTRLEMFARQRMPGWSIWGNQAPGGSDVSL